MPLDRYRQKRDFAKTPEPSGGQASKTGAPRFVVQKHAASRLHYDFRLEMDGVFKSWAVPKGPSLDTSERRLAVEVEDHPLDYGDFEGVIPEGEYGGGTVMVWDRGTYEPRGDAAELYEKGDLKVTLHGTKLQGDFVLVRMKRRAGEKKDNWLLIKERDEHVRPHASYDVLKELPDSAKTGRTMEEIASEKAAGPEDGEDADPSKVVGARPAPLPKAIAPELATKVDRVPEDQAWLHEIKLDGYRALCRVDGDDVRIFTRNGLDWTGRFGSVVTAIRELGLRSAWLDGEVTALLPDGRSSFGALHTELARGASAALTYFVFDLLYLDGYDLRGAPLRERKRLLALALAGTGNGIRYVDHVVGGGEAFYRQACTFALEGSVAKRADSPYRSGRGRDWLKRKCVGREDFVVVGFTLPSNGSAGVGALALAARSSAGALAYAGRVGTGWSAAQSRELRQSLESLAADAPALDVPRVESRGVHWTRPELVVEIAFGEWMADGILRHASFEGVREDLPDGPADPPPGRPPHAGSAPDVVAGVKLTHPDTVLYSGIGVSKRDLALYYERVAEWMLPHLANRPLVLVRCPEGAGEACFFQKNTATGFPSSIRHVVVQHEEGPVSYALVDSSEGLVALVQRRVLEIHTWGSLADDVERPDRLIFDLDPGPDVGWQALADGARAVRHVLDGLGLAGFLKTTGGKGLHVVVPIRRQLGWDDARDIAKAVAERVAASDPARYTTNPLKKYRAGRIFVDYVRNTRGATAVAAYSSRAREGAPVSVPLRWEELSGSRRFGPYDVRTVPRRLAALKRDPWEGYASAAGDLSAAGRLLGVLQGSPVITPNPDPRQKV